jgi:hypothetical protein
MHACWQPNTEVFVQGRPGLIQGCRAEDYDDDDDVEEEEEEKEKETQWPEFARELYRPSDHRFSTKLVPSFADRGCHMVSVIDPYGRILGFLD